MVFWGIPLASDAMGELLDELVEVAGQYHECRAAALAASR